MEITKELIDECYSLGEMIQKLWLHINNYHYDGDNRQDSQLIAPLGGKTGKANFPS